MRQRGKEGERGRGEKKKGSKERRERKRGEKIGETGKER